MRSHALYRHFRQAFVAMLALGLSSPGISGAEGITRIQHSDGSVKMYTHVQMHRKEQTLWLRSPDHQGVLEILTGACFFTGAIERCLPVMTTLHQHGRTHRIELEHGTVYFNLTGDPQILRHSFEALKAHEVLVALHTVRGTYISVRGTLDGEK